MTYTCNSTMVWGRITDHSADYLVRTVIVGGVYTSVGIPIVGGDLYQGSKDVMRRRGDCLSMYCSSFLRKSENLEKIQRHKSCVIDVEERRLLI